jgi:hypothetical protein
MAPVLHDADPMKLARRLALGFGAVLVAGSVGCAGGASSNDSTDDALEQADSTPATSYDPFTQLDTDLGEKLWDNERADVKATVEIIETFLKRRYAEGRKDAQGRVRYMRDAHAKPHGCVKGEFTVRADIPDDMKAGVFAAPQTYKAWLRYSNGNSEVRNDWKRDARGMALKLTNVPGTKLVTDLPEQTTQDFVMINHPVFFVDNPALYADTLKVFHSGLGFEALAQILSIAKLPLENAKLALAVNGSQIKNPLADPYWSMTAYRMGRGKAVKYAAIPVTCDAPTPDLASRIAEAKKSNSSFLPANDNRLREAMQETLEGKGGQGGHDACFVFALQRFVDQTVTPIEHSTVSWDEVSPFVPVADLRIPAQTFTSDAQDTFCEDLAFTPWHALPEHKPLGVVNRTRLLVYAATARLRREGNGVTSEAALHGPTGDERF